MAEIRALEQDSIPPLNYDAKPSQTRDEEVDINVATPNGWSALDSLTSLVGNVEDLLEEDDDPGVDSIGSGAGRGSALEALNELIEM
jgi:hypothetical protein